MSLDKAVMYGKEKRKHYKGAKSYDRACRNHGNCIYCKNNHLYKNIKRKISINEKLNELRSEHS